MKRLFLALVVLLLCLPVARAQAPELGYWDRTPLPQTGLATFYADGVMEYVHSYRRSLGQVPECHDCVGTVALLRAGDIGRKVWVQAPGSDPAGPFLVIDCARREDVEPLVARDWVVDVGFDLGRTWNMSRPLSGVTVFEDPADLLVGPQHALPTRFFVDPANIVISTPTPTSVAPAHPITPWPTRLPGALAAPTAGPIAWATTTGSFLRPVVTKPTVEGGAGASVVGLAPTAEAAEHEVALARPGLGVLVVGSATPPAAPRISLEPSAQPKASAEPTVTRTPRPDLAPILPVGAPLPAPTPPPTPGNSQWWRSILTLILH